MQTPAELAFPDNRTSHYIRHLRSLRHRLPEQVRHVLADSLYANFAFIHAVLQMGLELVSKLRQDANLRYLYKGLYSGKGRRKMYDGKVDYQDWSKWDGLDLDDDRLEGYTLVVNHQRFKENMRVVVIFPKGQPDKRRVLMCTDVEVEGVELLHWYKARFQIEFVIRDAKQHTGLCDGQMRSSQGLDFHFNSSLASLSLMYAQEKARVDDGVFSIASLKRRKYNETLLETAFLKLGLPSTCPKVQTAFHELRNYGVIAA